MTSIHKHNNFNWCPGRSLRYVAILCGLGRGRELKAHYHSPPEIPPCSLGPSPLTFPAILGPPFLIGLLIPRLASVDGSRKCGPQRHGGNTMVSKLAWAKVAWVAVLAMQSLTTFFYARSVLMEEL